MYASYFVIVAYFLAHFGLVVLSSCHILKLFAFLLSNVEAFSFFSL